MDDMLRSDQPERAIDAFKKALDELSVIIPNPK